jgi:hypothetical protein
MAGWQSGWLSGWLGGPESTTCWSRSVSGCVPKHGLMAVTMLLRRYAAFCMLEMLLSVLLVANSWCPAGVASSHSAVPVNSAVLCQVIADYLTPPGKSLRVRKLCQVAFVLSNSRWLIHRCPAQLCFIVQVIADYHTPPGKSLQRDLMATINAAVDFLVRSVSRAAGCTASTVCCAAAGSCTQALARFPSFKGIPNFFQAYHNRVTCLE